MILQFDGQNYDPKRMLQLREELFDVESVEVEEIVQKELVPPALFVILIIVPLLYFSKAFFTKLGESMGKEIGEKLGKEIGKDVVKAYNLLKKKIIEVIKNPKTKETPMVEFRFNIDQIEVSGFVKNNDEKILSNAFDRIQELYLMTENYVKRKNLEKVLSSFVFNLDLKEMAWKPTYYITIKNEIYHFED